MAPLPSPTSLNTTPRREAIDYLLDNVYDRSKRDPNLYQDLCTFLSRLTGPEALTYVYLVEIEALKARADALDGVAEVVTPVEVLVEGIVEGPIPTLPRRPVRPPTPRHIAKYMDNPNDLTNNGGMEV